jgi:hypothetical protein
MFDQIPRRRERAVLGWMLFTVVAAGAGLALTLVAPEMPGAEPMTLEDFVDAVAMLGFGVLGAAFVHRRVAEGLGLALVVLAVLSAVNYLLSGAADAIANGQPDPPAVAQVLSLVAEGAFVVTFFLLVTAPMLLFPTGQLPSRRWGWPAGAVAVGCLVSIVSEVFAPGPVDDDNPAWGDNPIGIPALSGSVATAVEMISLVLLATGLVLGVAAFVSRWVRYRGPRRRQMAWFSLGVVVLVAGMVTDLGGTVAVEVASALVIFGGLLVGMGRPLLGPLATAVEAAEAGGRTVDQAGRPAGVAHAAGRRRSSPGVAG